MSVPAHTNDWGSFLKNTRMGWLQYRTQKSNGALVVSQGDSDVRIAEARRLGKTNNPVISIKGMPWRRNSSTYRKVVKGTWQPGSYSYDTPLYSYEISGVRYAHSDWGAILSGPLSAGDAWYFTDAQMQARVEALLKLNSGKANYGQFLAEAVESSNMLADSLIRLFEGLIAVKRNGLRAAAKAGIKGIRSKDISSGYLEWMYGWRPLCKDIFDMYEDFKPKLQPPLIMEGRKTVRSSHTDRSDRTQTGAVWKDRFQACIGRNTCHLYGRISDATIAKASSGGLINPLSLAWEVVPYSFVVDWAMPVGNTLAALTASAGLTFVDGSENEVREGHVVADCHWNGINYRSGTPEGLQCDVFALKRGKLAGFPGVSLYGKSPFSTVHTANALNLLYQLVDKR